MPHVVPWIMLLAALVGNCGFWLFAFNRINSTGLPRKVTKIGEKSFVFLCFAIPVISLLWEHEPTIAWLSTPEHWLPSGIITPVWILASLSALVVLGPIWLESRLWILSPKNLVGQSGQQYHVDAKIAGKSAANRTTRVLKRVPFNQILHAEVTSKILQLPRSISGISGLKIGHISDLHFTGQLSQEHYKFVLDRLQELEPDLIAITGDIIDYEKCLPWLEEILGPLKAPLGRLFILGNHDCRIPDTMRVCHQMTALNYTDIGANAARIVTPSGLNIEICGNERPWLDRPGNTPTQWSDQPDTNTLRLALSHAPDQIRWARDLSCDLMLAGHTHGGQVRIPGIGPIVSPSRYGSRFASGVFLRKPTLMHVSRGVAGTHPLRWRCMPEVSLLTLQ